MQCVVAISPLSEMGMQQFSLNIGLSDFFVGKMRSLFL